MFILMVRAILSQLEHIQTEVFFYFIYQRYLNKGLNTLAAPASAAIYSQQINKFARKGLPVSCAHWKRLKAPSL